MLCVCSALSESDASDDEVVLVEGEELPVLRTRRVKTYSPEAYKFYMEQHVENVIKSYKARKRRRWQLEAEMNKVSSVHTFGASTLSYQR